MLIILKLFLFNFTENLFVMKLLTIILSVIAIVLIGYNVTIVDFNAPFIGESFTALITIFTSLCALVLLQILAISKKIEKKAKKQ